MEASKIKETGFIIITKEQFEEYAAIKEILNNEINIREKFNKYFLVGQNSINVTYHVYTETDAMRDFKSDADMGKRYIKELETTLRGQFKKYKERNLIQRILNTEPK